MNRPDADTLGILHRLKQKFVGFFSPAFRQKIIRLIEVDRVNIGKD